DGYPILKGISRTAQLKAQNLLAKYNLSLNASPEAGGTLSGGGLVEVGDKVTLSATAATGYQFVNWTDDAENNLSTEASFIYTMPASDVSLTANFDILTLLNDKEATKIQVWPNPFEAEILISGGTDIKQVTLVTLLGETIFKTDYSVSNIQTSQLSPGVYILKIEDNDGRISSYTLIKK
ncbi:MAG: T9SS type A sorting domain-containing protein, partial [Bacteroidales bacterium]|nr:T9SS type A sorting domain-containing protein [Bacteroidales bacterium]